jgi:hypothetical protein
VELRALHCLQNITVVSLAAFATAFDKALSIQEEDRSTNYHLMASQTAPNRLLQRYHPRLVIRMFLLGISARTPPMLIAVFRVFFFLF